MQQPAAIRRAIDLVQVPTRVRAVRTEPLPEGVDRLLSIAVGDEDAIQTAAAYFKRPPAFLRNAANFFIEQILLAPEADSYRILGALPSAATADLRRNMAFIVRWLHPDVAESKDRSIFAARVTAAWEDLKTADRRSAYDARRTEAAATSTPVRGAILRSRRFRRTSANAVSTVSKSHVATALRRLIDWASLRRPRQH